MCYYYGFSVDQVLSMNAEDFYILASAIEVIDARNALIGFQVSDWPHMKKETRAKIFNSLQRRIRNKIEGGNRSRVTVTELARMLSGGVGYGRAASGKN